MSSWSTKFQDGNVKLNEIKYDYSWNNMFEKLLNDKRICRIEDELSKELRQSANQIHPSPELVFNTFLLTPFDRVKVIIIGQDPYFDTESFGEKEISQAMGLAFSVPVGCSVPSSLNNIYKNMLHYGHIKNMPKHGNLEFWASQGCLMLNTSLTVLHGRSNVNCHQSLWKWFTDAIIKYISDNKDKVIFVLWGANALEKANIIDSDKHEIIISSHPSGLSADRLLKNYPSFNNYDHFGKINSILEKWKIDKIIW